MKKILVFVLSAILVISIFLTSCKSDDDSVQIIKSNSSELTLEFPSSWIEIEINEDATIQMADSKTGYSFLVIEESADYFTDDFTLDDYTSLTLDQMKSLFGETGNLEVTNSFIGNDILSRQFEISGTFDGEKSTQLIVCAKAGRMFYAFSCAASQSDFETAKPVFERIVKSADFGMINEDEAQGSKSDIITDADEDTFQTVRSNRSGLAIEVPASWIVDEDLNADEDMTISVADGSKGYSFTVIEQSSDIFVSDFDLDDYSSLLLGIMMDEYGTAEAPEIIDAFIGQDIPIKQFEIEGAVNGLKIKQLVVFVKTSETYFFFTATSPLAKYDEIKTVFERIINSADFGINEV